MASPFDIYKKANSVAFELSDKVTLKMAVHFNQVVKTQSGDTYTDTIHNEFVLPNGDITTNLKFRYYLSLSPKHFFKFGLSISWDIYDDFCELINKASNIDIDPTLNPYHITYDEFGAVQNISVNNAFAPDLSLEDFSKHSIRFIPIVMNYKFDTIKIPGLKLIFGDLDDVSFDIPLKRIKGLNRFLNTYNPLQHALTIATYMVSSPLLGTNRKKVEN